MKSELELHDWLLEEMDVLVDRSQTKLDRSEKRLEGFAKSIRNNSEYSLYYILNLIQQVEFFGLL